MKSLHRLYTRNRSTFIITIFGFAAGLTGAFLLLMYIQYESSYDRHWNNADRIFKLHEMVEQNGQTTEYPVCIRQAYTAIPDQVPGVKSAVQLYRTFSPELQFRENRYRNLKIFYADSTFFNVFQMNVIAGDLQDALHSSDAIVLNKRTAINLFGNTNPVGRLVDAYDASLPEKGQTFRVAAVIPDLPNTSHFDFDALLPMSSNTSLQKMQGLEFYTYLILRETADISTTTAAITSLYDAMLGDWIRQINIPIAVKTHLLPIRDVYLHSNAIRDIGIHGDLHTLRVFILLTFLILSVAVANYVNLMLLQGSRRAQETGMRKMLGASRFELILQFLKDSSVVTALAFLLAIGLAALLIGPFAEVIRRPLHINILLNPTFIASLIAIYIVISLIAGTYPALYLSGYRPTEILKGNSSSIHSSHRLQKVLVLAQFAICMVLLSNLFILQRQYTYMNNRPLGFDAQNVVAFQELSPQLQQRFDLIKNELTGYSGITEVTGSHSRPGEDGSGQGIKMFGQSDASRIKIREVRVQPDFLKTYGIQLQAGRGFQADRSTDRNAVILNEMAVSALGIENPLGKQVDLFGSPMDIIGVTQNYHYASLRNPIEPVIFTYYQDQIRTISVRYSEINPGYMINAISDVLRKYDSSYIPDYVFLDQAFRDMYSSEGRLIMLVRGGALLAFLLTLLGLIAVTSITVGQRTKEIGVRKAIGASSGEIVQLLVGSRLYQYLAAIIIAGIGAFWIARMWLQNYAYHITLDIGGFLAAGSLVLIVALIATGVIGLRASRLNPVDALRYE